MIRGFWAVSAVLVVAVAVVRGPAICVSADDLCGPNPPENGIWLETLDLSRVCQQWGSARAGKSVQGKAITIRGVTFKHGVGSHAESEIVIDLKGTVTGFASVVGVDDATAGKGSVCFEVWADGRKIAESGTLRGRESKMLSADLTGARKLLLRATDAGDGIDFDYADWAGAVLFLAPDAAEKPRTSKPPPEPLPEIASGVAPEPAIHGPRVVGATPGRPFLFLIPATGEGPLAYSAKNLPEGLTLDPDTGIITGSIKSAGTFIVKLTVRGPKAETARKLKIVRGERKLALTPPMGWNSWNVWARAVDADKARAAADWMVKSGLAAHGYQYVNIDDCWEAGRDESGAIRPNEKFPDMKALADYVHGKGLKIGIYSSPGPKTCAGFEGSWGHESQDAETYAEWGFDYLKYDWCSYSQIARPGSLEDMQTPYRVMRRALDECDRDIVFSLCQYGMGSVWKWGGAVGGNCWRTTGDIKDNWGSMAGIGFSQDGREKFAGPGRWNDMDMLVVGKLGWGRAPRPSMLTPNEQLTHITLWCLLSSPLLLGCDLSQMDQFTIDLVTNDDVLDVNQDPLGKPASRKARTDATEVWARPLWDGATAVGLFNHGCDDAEVTAKWSDLGVSGPQPVRDLWRKKDLGAFDDCYKVIVPRHGAALIKVGKPNRTDW
ncbi:MAG: NPCBM/NEW2 domain-containing protein [Armatimonadota bacterium]|nr:NPCBM/NEW2 domain-containing protein [Armatimonadota bacterium]